ncbi:MAG: hypothetical protein EDM77_14575 [Candidatus Jettenia sp. AMX1]|nr:MAG: hypothetical protein EDM77_14575 [Candidatus Jettenia sp. AMX1]MCE7881821.1 hypothetical protein [Candidatus Jettenia sp. AMX1]MCQ3927134.1 hypothetical protein [Candidatus Jettenia sp.]
MSGGRGVDNLYCNVEEFQFCRATLQGCYPRVYIQAGGGKAKSLAPTSYEEIKVAEGLMKGNLPLRLFATLLSEMTMIVIPNGVKHSLIHIINRTMEIY